MPLHDSYNPGIGTELRILGPLELHTHGGSIPLGGSKPRRLLAALTLHPNEVVSNGLLEQVVWGDCPPPSARQNLLTYVSALRRTLARSGCTASIEAQPPGYRLVAGPGNLDAARFTALLRASQARELRRALDLWRGPVLADVADALPLLQGRIAALEEERMTALLGRIEADLADGRHQRITAELARLVTEYPLHERLREKQMLALYRSGRQAEALEAYRNLTALLRDELGIDPDSEIAALHEAILRNDLSLAWSAGTGGTASETASAASRTVAPRLHPAEPSVFAGRDVELTELTVLLARTQTAVVTGPPGVGKTTLALRWARHAEQRFPDGTLFADLRGFCPDGAAANTAEVLEVWLNMLGHEPGSLPAGLDARAALLRGTLACRRALLIIDNAADVAQVRPLLPGPGGCRALVTSRHRLTGLSVLNGASVLPLAPLDQAASMALLARIIPRARIDAEPAAAAELSRLCGGLPLALRIAAERTQNRPGLGLTELARQLAAEHQRLDLLATGDDESSAVRSVFSWSYRALPPAAALMFRLLGLFPGASLGTGAAAALAATTREQAGRALDNLTDAHLLLPRPRGRYACHDLLRLYAAELARTGENGRCRAAAAASRAVTMARLLTWQLYSAAAANKAIDISYPYPDLPVPRPSVDPECFDGYDDAMAWLDAERDNLLPLTKMAAATGNHELAWQLAHRGFAHLNRRGSWHLYIALGEAGLASARAAGNRFGEAELLHALSGAHNGIGQPERAIELNEQAIKISADLGDELRVGVGLGRLGHSLTNMGRYEEAARRTGVALAVFREVGHEYYTAMALAGLGRAYDGLGRPAEAARCFEEAIAGFRVTGGDVHVANVLHYYAIMEFRHGRLDEAQRYTGEALRLRRARGDVLGKAETLLLAGDLASSLGDDMRARAAWREALEIYAAAGDQRAEQLHARLAATG